jgi:NAD(P)-dependent dehydrogenase (short-subunit alcohol dehydrogenase family)
MVNELLSLQGQVALVVGAGKGIGRALAVGMAQAGADVAAVSRTQADLDALSTEITALGRRFVPLCGDATKSAYVAEAVEKTMQTLGSIDVLVNAVGGSFRKPVIDTTDEEWDAAVQSNLTSTFYACRDVGRIMLRAKRGSVINISSSAGLRGRPNNSSYSATKAAIINFSRALAMEWGSSGVRVNVICPGRILTSATAPEMNDPAKYAAYIKNVPVGRIGQPEELKPIAVWLASAASGFATGSVIVLDGGQTLL